MGEIDCSCSIKVYPDYLPDEEEDEVIVEMRRGSAVTCDECREAVPAGEQYEYVEGMWDGDLNIYITCEDCLSMRAVFFEHEWNYSDLWGDLYDSIDDTIPENCIRKLTPKARDRVCDMIQATWEEE